MNNGPITHNGIHPITHMRPKVEKHGEIGHAQEKKPAEAEVKRQGATRHSSPEKDGKDVAKQVADANAKSGESKSQGTTSASHDKKKTMAEIMYPQRKGLRGMVLEE